MVVMLCDALIFALSKPSIWLLIYFEMQFHLLWFAVGVALCIIVEAMLLIGFQIEASVA
jgi:hypothetical protein